MSQVQAEIRPGCWWPLGGNEQICCSRALGLLTAPEFCVTPAASISNAVPAVKISLILFLGGFGCADTAHGLLAVSSHCLAPAGHSGSVGAQMPQNSLKPTFPPPWAPGTATGGVWESLDGTVLMPAGHR